MGCELIGNDTRGRSKIKEQKSKMWNAADGILSVCHGLKPILHDSTTIFGAIDNPR